MSRSMQTLQSELKGRQMPAAWLSILSLNKQSRFCSFSVSRNHITQFFSLSGKGPELQAARGPHTCSPLLRYNNVSLSSMTGPVKS